MKEVDEKFYQRADDHINLSNSQISGSVGRGKVSASFMFSLTRFNAWVSATSWTSAEAMADDREQTIEYFMAEYRQMLEQNLDDYIENFDSYIPKKEG